MKCAVFPCLGLGDGLIALILSHNLANEGHQVDTFHPFLGQMQSFFPSLPILPRSDNLEILDQYDKIFFIYEKLEWMQKQIAYVGEKYPNKRVVLNPIATPNCDYPYWEEGRFNGTKPFGDNLLAYCRDVLNIKNPTKDNGICLPSYIKSRRNINRVILHPTSSRKGKNWKKEQFLKLSEKLEKEKFHPVFILTKEEKKEWPKTISAPDFKDLNAVTTYVAESGWMIGNDSGIGHLASLVGVPTLTICRSQLAANFWRPSWSKAEVIVPPKWVPNLKGLRLRDKRWQQFISVSQVEKAFSKLRKLCIFSH